MPWAVAGRPLSVGEPHVQSLVLFSSPSALTPSVFSLGRMDFNIISMTLAPKFVSPFHLFLEPQTHIQLPTQCPYWNVQGKTQYNISKTDLLSFLSASLHLAVFISVKGHCILPLPHSFFPSNLFILWASSLGSIFNIYPESYLYFSPLLLALWSEAPSSLIWITTLAPYAVFLDPHSPPPYSTLRKEVIVIMSKCKLGFYVNIISI